MSETLVASLTATGTTSSITVKSGILSLSGTFSATVKLEVDANGDGNWAAAGDSTGAALSLTTPVSMRVENGVACPTRLNCTAFTSGTIVARLRST